MKLLPFDNKSELQVVLNLPEGSSLEDTERALFGRRRIARALPEVRLGPGLCRHRRAVQLQRPGTPLLSARSRRNWATCRSISRRRARATAASHAIALDLRQRLRRTGAAGGQHAQVVEVPPGPPVLATLLAEIYGPDAATRRAVAEEMKTLFRSVPFIVDVDD